MALGGKVWVYTGDSMSTYVTKYQEDEDCMAHDFYDNIEVFEEARSIADLISRTITATGEKAVAIDFEEDLILVRGCKECGTEGFSKLRSAFGLGEGLCLSCGEELVDSFGASIEINDPRVSVPFKSLGLPISEIITIRTDTRRVHYGVQGSIN
jgi:hypothetical protein